MGPLIPLALGVAQYAGPKLAQWIFGDEGDVRLDWRGASHPVAPVAFPTAEPPFVCS